MYDGELVQAYQIGNNNGMLVEIINYGATITKITVPDRNGQPGNVVIGFESMQGYLQNGQQYFGSIVGRFCNRIGNARFELDGKTYHLAANNGVNNLHGGIKGFDKVCWQAKILDDSSLQLSYLSVDGEEGFPGNLSAELVYQLTENNELVITYKASCDKPSPVNLTNHSYFNLSAGTEPTILDHVLSIHADQYSTLFIEPEASEILANVAGTPLDFNSPKPLRQDLDKLAGGYDHHFVLNKSDEPAAVLYHPGSGRLMEVFTTKPGLQLYTGNFLEHADMTSTGSAPLKNHGAICLETQHLPDSPNQPGFPSCFVGPGQPYTHTCIYKFSTHE